MPWGLHQEEEDPDVIDCDAECEFLNKVDFQVIMRLGVVGDQAYSQGFPCFCRALFEIWCVIYDGLFGFKAMCFFGGYPQS